MNMDKIEKIRQEIGRLKRLISDSNYYLDNSEQVVGYESALDDLNEFIGTLSEALDKSLEEEIEMEWDSFNKHLVKYDDGSEEVVWLNWLSFVDIACHFYSLGLNARKEENK